MSSPFAGDPAKYPVELQLPDDGDARNASSVNTPFEALAHRTAFLKSKLGAIPALSFNTSVGTTNSFSVVKYSPALSRWFGVCSNVTDYVVSTNQLLVWPAVTEMSAPVQLGNVAWDLDVDAAGNTLTVFENIDNVLLRTAAGAWSFTVGAEGDGTDKPNVLYEPVSTNWIFAYKEPGAPALVVRTIDAAFTAHTNRTEPTFPATAEVTLGTDGLGRVVMQGFDGTDTYFSYSDDGGATWSAPTTHALGFTYSVGTRHNPKPAWTGTQWVAVGCNAAGNVSRVFNSVDGITWVVASSLATEAIHSIAALHGIVLGMTNLSSHVHSVDGGVTWRKGEGTYIFSAAAAPGVAASPSRFILLAVSRIFPGIAFGEGGGLVT